MSNIDEETLALLDEVAVRAVKKHKELEAKQRQKKIMHNTFALMENYVSLKNFTRSAVSEPSQIECTERFESNEYLNSIRKSRTKTILMIAHIDEAIKELRREATRSGEQYKFEAFYMYYVKKKTYEDIQEKLDCGKNSPARWCKEMIKRLSVKLFGVDGIEKW